MVTSTTATTTVTTITAIITTAITTAIQKTKSRLILPEKKKYLSF